MGDAHIGLIDTRDTKQAPPIIISYSTYRDEVLRHAHSQLPAGLLPGALVVLEEARREESAHGTEVRAACDAPVRGHAVAPADIGGATGHSSHTRSRYSCCALLTPAAPARGL